MTFPSATPSPPPVSFNRATTMSSSLAADYATIKVSWSPLHGPSPRSNRNPAATSREFASVPTDRPSLAVAIPRLHPAHAHVRARLLLFDVSACRSLLSRLTLSPRRLPKGIVRESTVAILASVLGGFGTVAMFCTVGVYV
jgi:hypothetical protein